jgi:hypothetical protein
MTQQGSSQFVIASFIFAVVLIYFAISAAFEKSKLKLKAQSQEVDISAPDFPVPEIPKSRMEQLNG